jgi:hypothetical protein
MGMSKSIFLLKGVSMIYRSGTQLPSKGHMIVSVIILLVILGSVWIVMDWDFDNREKAHSSACETDADCQPEDKCTSGVCWPRKTSVLGGGNTETGTSGSGVTETGTNSNTLRKSKTAPTPKKTIR